LRGPGVFESLVKQTEKLGAGIGAAAEAAGIPVYQTQVGTMFCAFFSAEPVTDWDSASRADTERYGKFFWAMLDEGVYLAPSQYEAGFMSLAHDDAVIEQTVKAAERAFKQLT
jgi:glutamate-1-semialdehyde 2,1-aminomutase